MAKFEGQERRMPKIEAALKEYGMTSLEEARDLCLSKGIDVESIVKGVQPIAFENAVWAYTLGAAIAIKKGVTEAAKAAETLGIGLQAFCVPGSVADQRAVGLGHGNLGAMLLRDETKCCWMKTPSASASWRAMNPLPPQKAPSALPKPPTKCVPNRFALS